MRFEHDADLVFEPLTGLVHDDSENVEGIEWHDVTLVVEADHTPERAATLDDPGDDEDIQIGRVWLNGQPLDVSAELENRLELAASDYLTEQAERYESHKEDRAEARRKGEL